MTKVKVKTKVKKSKVKEEYKSFIDKGDGLRYMICRNSKESSPFFKGILCGTYQPVPPDVVAILCSRCTSKLVGFEEPKRRVKSDKPRGWAFMKEYVHKDGKVFHKGVEQPELFGTIDPTVIETTKKKKLTKYERQTARAALFVEFNKLKKEHIKEKRKTYKSKIKSAMNKIQREIKKIK